MNSGTALDGRFSAAATPDPIFEHFGVQLWVPEVGDPIYPGSEAHDLAMTLFGSQSKGERMRIKTRVRAAMRAQTAIQGASSAAAHPTATARSTPAGDIWRRCCRLT